MNLNLITAKDNPSVRLYRQLRDRKKIRRTEQAFVIEGFRIITDALQYPELVQKLLITETAWKKYASVLEQNIPPDMPLLLLSDTIGNLLTDTEHTQGIFAICNMPPRKQAEDILHTGGKYLVLYQLQDPGNMGMILRTCDALGLEAVFTSECCEVYSPKVIRATMGSVFRVSVYDEPDVLQLISLLKAHQICCYAAVPTKHAKILTECNLKSGSSAVWIGNEGNGLPEKVISACNNAVTIPMKGGAESLNAAMAAGILIWEMMKSGENGYAE